MADSNAARVKRVRMAPTLSGRDRIKVLLAAQGFTVASWARDRGFHDSQVWMCISGTRPYPEIREALAEDLDKARTTIDGLIAGQSPEDGGDDGGQAGELGHAPKVNGTGSPDSTTSTGSVAP